MENSGIVRGYLNDLKEIRSKNGDAIAFGRIGEKLYEFGNSLDLIFFSDAWNMCQNSLNYDEVVVFKGDFVVSARMPNTYFVVSSLISDEEYESCKNDQSTWDFLTDTSEEVERGMSLDLDKLLEEVGKVHGLKRVRDYQNLSDEEIIKYQSLIILPNIDFPHYEPLIIDDITIHEHKDINPIAGERFEQSHYLFHRNPFDSKKLLVSNYGRIIYDNEIVTPFVVGTFLHCQKVYIKKIGEYYLHRIVKETFDPMANMNDLYVHHLNNNALDNRLENLLWVSETDHNKIHENNYELMRIGRIIYGKNKKDLLELFNKNSKKTFNGKELINFFPNVFPDVIKYNIYSLLKEYLIYDLTENNNAVFINRKYSINKN